MKSIGKMESRQISKFQPKNFIEETIHFLKRYKYYKRPKTQILRVTNLKSFQRRKVIMKVKLKVDRLIAHNFCNIRIAFKIIKDHNSSKQQITIKTNLK